MIKQVIPVAIAVLAYGDNLLLATRHQDQHQGGKLEFVGGKIEQGETPIHALRREVAEEIGLDISGNLAVKLEFITIMATSRSTYTFTTLS